MSSTPKKKFTCFYSTDSITFPFFFRLSSWFLLASIVANFFLLLRSSSTRKFFPVFLIFIGCCYIFLLRLALLHLDVIFRLSDFHSYPIRRLYILEKTQLYLFPFTKHGRALESRPGPAINTIHSLPPSQNCSAISLYIIHRYINRTLCAQLFDKNIHYDLRDYIDVVKWLTRYSLVSLSSFNRHQAFVTAESATALLSNTFNAHTQKARPYRRITMAFCAGVLLHTTLAIFTLLSCCVLCTDRSPLAT